MSKEDDDQARKEEAKLYRCCKKYGKIVNQVRELDEIAESLDAARSKSSKKKRKSGGEGSSSSAANGSVPDNQENLNQVLVETITKFLNELNEDNDPKPSNNP